MVIGVAENDDTVFVSVVLAVSKLSGLFNRHGEGSAVVQKIVGDSARTREGFECPLPWYGGRISILHQDRRFPFRFLGSLLLIRSGFASRRSSEW